MDNSKVDSLSWIRNKFIFTLLCVFGFGLIAHGYAFFNMLYNTDSMLIYQNDDEWMLGLGRFMMPIYEKIRGRYYPPSVVGFLALLFISVSLYLFFEMFEVEDRVVITLICMIFASNFLVRNLFEQFMHDADAYMFSLMLATIGVFAWDRFRYGFAVSFVCFVCSIGLYQAYLQAGITLFILLAIRRLLSDEDNFKVIKCFLSQMLIMLAAISTYYFLAKLAQRVTGVAANNNMNSIGAAFHTDGIGNLIKLIGKMYVDVFYTAFTQSGHLNTLKLFAVVIVLFTALILSGICLRRTDIKKKNKLTIILLFLILPAGMECIYVISNGFFHSLMRFSMYFVFGICIIIIYDFFSKKNNIIKNKIFGIGKNINKILCILIIFIFVDNVICAGNQYLQKDMIWQSTMFNMTRIIDRLEQTDGYEPGKPVVFIGDMEKAAFNMERPDFYVHRGSHVHFTTSYYRLYERYFQKLLGYPIWILPREDAVAIEQNPETADMPPFPGDGCIKEVDGVFVVKMSDVKLEVYGQSE